MTSTMDPETTPAALPLPLPELTADGHLRAELPPRIQTSYTTRHVGRALAAAPQRFHLATGPTVTPRAGDVVVARVVEINNHKRVETAESRKAILFEGSLILLAYGNRYAADQFLAHVPDSLQTCHLVAAGGVAGLVTEQHEQVDDPTVIQPLGLLEDEHGVVTLERFAAHRLRTVTDLDSAQLPGRPRVIGVLGTSMNSGKSTAMACLINGLAASGLTVSAGKSTGTGAGNDPMLYHDGGAAKVLDFTDFGFPTTFQLDYEQVLALSVNLVDALSAADTDVVVLEIADGVYQGETARLLRDPIFHSVVDTVVFAATDALGAVAGVRELQDAGLQVAAVSGVLTSSPLATAEARTVLDVPVVETHGLTDGAVAAELLPQL